MYKTEHRSVFISPAGLCFLLDEHKKTCKSCRQKAAVRWCLTGKNLKRDLILAMERARYHPAKPKKGVPVSSSTLYIVFNPKCKHDRTTYSQAHCPECLSYSRQMQALE